jgi:hypothetical protein
MPRAGPMILPASGTGWVQLSARQQAPCTGASAIHSAHIERLVISPERGIEGCVSDDCRGKGKGRRELAAFVVCAHILSIVSGRR